MFASINDATLHYRSDGEGPPVVFLHGLGGSANIWHGVMAAMTQHHHCVAMDLRGHGRSSGAGRFSIEGFAKDVEGLVRHLELPAITLVGHSMGSLVAQQLAHRRQDLVSHLVLVGAISQFEPATSEAYRARAQQVEDDGLDGLVDAWLAGAVSPQTHALQSGATGLLRELFLRNDPASYAKATRALAEAPSIRRDELGQPTLILTGAHDRSTPLAMSEELHRSIPVSRVEVLPDVAHWSPVEAPGRIAASILEFLT
ncbi:alpha/beta fold hydrolase [Salsipaludibacter albus]|uniref:alpha/beta fold hydrolase n=1 Tax=Salsipaludibacter albus TaxID=2849650 RepID=UPI001EE4B18F|nr:alpha/beta fold hydrolase [Salsipaludibacter albus]MBY5163087.1 alpha/beta hydrolase [Salsipaludibacter albus]